jgi:hypothetical protein
MPDSNDEFRGETRQALKTIIENQVRASERHHAHANEIAAQKAVLQRLSDRFDAHAKQYDEDLNGVVGDPNRPGIKTQLQRVDNRQKAAALIWRVCRWAGSVIIGVATLVFTAAGSVPQIWAWLGSHWK